MAASGIVGRGDAEPMLVYLKELVHGRIEPDERYVAKPGPHGCTFATAPRPTQGALASLAAAFGGNGAGRYASGAKTTFQDDEFSGS